MKHECCEESKKNILEIFRKRIDGVARDMIIPDQVIMTDEDRKDGEIIFSIAVNNSLCGYGYFRILYCPWCGDNLEVKNEK